MNIFDMREAKEIYHALWYRDNLSHGTVGHNLLIIIAKFASEAGFHIGPDGLLWKEDLATGDSERIVLE